MSILKKSKGKVCLSLLLSFMLTISIIVNNTSFVSAFSDTKTIQILGTSDVHGRFDAYSYANNKTNSAGSLTQIAQKVKELKSENPNTLLVDAGDSVQDNMADIFLDDPVHPMLVAMNYMNYDTWTLGNHEFNHGSQMVEKLVKEPKATVLCGNIYKKDGTLLGKPYFIKTVDGVRVAIIGMTTPNIMKWDGPKLNGYKVTSPIDETKKIINEIKAAKSADIFVAVVHMGLDVEYQDDDSAKKLAEACPELSAIVAGHAHTEIPCEKVGNTIITEPGKFGEKLSQINLTVQPKSDGGYEIVTAESKLISIKDMPEEEELKNILKPYHDRAIVHGNETIGALKGGALVSDDYIPGITQAQVEDTALMHLILDTQAYYTKQYAPKGARCVTSAALLSATSNIQAGAIKIFDMVNIYKYDNTLCTMKLTGKQLKKYMEWSASYFNQYHDGDLTVSFNPKMASYLYNNFLGVNYDINISKPEGSRIENLTYPDGKVVKDTDIIYFTTNDYLTNSRIKADLFKNEAIEIIHSTANDTVATVRDFLALYIKDAKKGVITNQFTPNWKLTGFNFDPAQRALVKKLVTDGTIQIPKSENGKNYNAKSITKNDIKPYLSQIPSTPTTPTQPSKPQTQPENKKQNPATGSQNMPASVAMLLVCSFGVLLYGRKKNIK